MRTTLTLDPDVAALVKAAMRQGDRTLKAVVNDAIRESLQPGGQRAPREPYRVKPHHARLLGHDPMGFNRLADELEDGATVAARERR